MAASSKKADRWHVHGCPTCRRRFEDACGDWSSNPQCSACRGGRPIEAWQIRIPRDCCFVEARDISRDRQTKLAWRLAGSCPWFKCQACGRTFPFSKPRADDWTETKKG